MNFSTNASHNNNILARLVIDQDNDMLRLHKLCPKQIYSKLQVDHESLYLCVYADKAHGVTLWKKLSCQKHKLKNMLKNKLKNKNYFSARFHLGQIPKHRTLSESQAHFDKGLQVGNWSFDIYH
jgi:IS30 family transposase